MIIIAPVCWQNGYNLLVEITHKVYMYIAESSINYLQPLTLKMLADK